MYVTGPQLDSIDAYIKAGNYAAAAPIMIAGAMTTDDLKGIWPVSEAAVSALQGLGVKGTGSTPVNGLTNPQPAPVAGAVPVAAVTETVMPKPFKLPDSMADVSPVVWAGLAYLIFKS